MRDSSTSQIGAEGHFDGASIMKERLDGSGCMGAARFPSSICAD